MTSPTIAFSEDSASAAAIGSEMLAPVDPLQLVESVVATVRPGGLLRAGGRLAVGIGEVLTGRSSVTIPPKDSRFADPAWRDNPVYRRLGQAYLVWAEEMMGLVEKPDIDWRTQERSRFFMTMLTTALAPSNTLPGNPEALKKVFDTAGRSLLRGVRNFAGDLAKNRGLPTQVDISQFRVGENIAATPGAVVHREEMFEILQYSPTTERVRELPLLLLPPMINKYYFWDLAPGRSLIEYAVGQGFTLFVIVWRDPRPEHGGWGMEDYVGGQLRAIDVVCEIAGTPSVNVFGDCSGGMSTALMLGHMAATGDERVRSATYGVTVLDFSQPSAVGMTASERSLRGAKERAARREVIAARDVANTFVWMRPNDLVWKYVVNNWLLGNDPPAFDVLFWNNDGQGLPSQLAYDLARMTLENSTSRPGEITLLGTPIDLSRVKCDSYLVAGITDHISPWKPCYAATQLLGGASEFVLTSTGHVQSIINPPGKPRASYHTGGRQGPDPDAWLASATKHQDSWWPHWTQWLGARSGKQRPARTALGSERHPPLGPAPGRYVLGE
jgi:polyhydroxyalkanoate synthase